MQPMSNLRVLIVDDSTLWINQGKKLLEQDGHSVAGVIVSDPKQFISGELSLQMTELLAETDVLLVDKDFSGGITSTRLVCVVRQNFPHMPIIRWTGGYENTPHMQFLGVTCIDKPTKRSEAKFAETFRKALLEQKLIISGPMGIFDSLDETVGHDKHVVRDKTGRLRQIAQIAQLSTTDCVDSGNWEYPWTITGRSGGVTKHELGHCVCDGVLTADDIRPLLSDLQKVISKFETAGEIDERFEICAEFIRNGNLDELELVKGCY